MCLVKFWECVAASTEKILFGIFCPLTVDFYCMILTFWKSWDLLNANETTISNKSKNQISKNTSNSLVNYHSDIFLLCFFNRKDMIRQMMTKIFRCIEPELNNLIALGDKIDSFNSLYMLVKMSHHVWTAQNVDPASFLSTTLGNVLVTVKRNFDKCIVSSLVILIKLTVIL